MYLSAFYFHMILNLHKPVATSDNICFLASRDHDVSFQTFLGDVDPCARLFLQSRLGFINLLFDLKSLIIYQQVWSFLLLSIWYHYKYMTPSKSMPLKSNHGFNEKCPYVGREHSNPCVLMTSWSKTGFLAVRQRFRIQVSHIRTWNLAKR